MSTRKQREILRQKRMQFDARVAENRAKREQEERLDAMTKANLSNMPEKTASPLIRLQRRLRF